MAGARSAPAVCRCRASPCGSSILSGKDIAPGQEGELIVRGPNVMPGYHNKPEETRTALRKGWYHTGDLAKCDEYGFLTITGRMKELIIRGGQNIAPAEIEEVVNTFAPVLDCAVVGGAHEHLGEVPALFVVARPGQNVEIEAVLHALQGSSVGLQNSARGASNCRNSAHWIG